MDTNNSTDTKLSIKKVEKRTEVVLQKDNILNKKPKIKCEPESDLQLTDILANYFEVCGLCLKPIDSSTNKKNHICSTDNQPEIENNSPITFQIETFYCAKCPKKYMTKTRYLKHIKEHDTKKLRRLECDVCGKIFVFYAHLRRHMHAHTGEKPHKCTYCPKAFSGSTHLKEHLLIHTGKKPFKCDVCGESFYRIDQLRAHMTKHSGEKPHVCKVCTKAFRSQTSLSAHKKIHLNISVKCDICFKHFTRMDSLRYHEKAYCKKDILKKSDTKVLNQKNIYANRLRKRNR